MWMGLSFAKTLSNLYKWSFFDTHSLVQNRGNYMVTTPKQIELSITTTTKTMRQTALLTKESARY